MPEGTFLEPADEVAVAAVEAAVPNGEVRQLADGRAGVYLRSPTVSLGSPAYFRTKDQIRMPKATGFVALAGGRAYWDHSASNVTYRRVNDRDFYLGRFVADEASADSECDVNLNVPEWEGYGGDLLRDPFATAPVGTQALGGFLPPQRYGGAIKLLLSATNEAQKVDALSRDGFVTGANAIVEGIVRVVSDGAGTTPDFNIGIANATHATDADSITDSLFIHLDGNSTNINAESDDGTTEVAATDTTVDYTEGTRFEFWFDMRNPADVQVYVNGSLVLSATVFNVNASAATWLLLAHLEKTASTDTYEVDIEMLKFRTAEQ